MKKILNDYGNEVIQIGAEGSVSYNRNKYPKLINELNELFTDKCEQKSHAVDKAIELIRANNITDERLTLDILNLSLYGGLNTLTTNILNNTF